MKDVNEAFESIASGDSAFNKNHSKVGAAVEQVNANRKQRHQHGSKNSCRILQPILQRRQSSSAMVPAPDPDRHDSGSKLRGTAMI